MSFEITFLGSSGGPIEGSTCSILLKPANITYKEIILNNISDQLICIDAGSGIASLAEIICNEVNFKQSSSKLLKFYNDSLPLTNYFKAEISTPFKDLSRSESPIKLAQDIFNSIDNYLITHPHLDHIAALVINSAGFKKRLPKNIYGSKFTIHSLQKYIFNGLIWPNLARSNIISLVQKEFWKPFHICNENFTILMFDLSHGKIITKNCKDLAHCGDRDNENEYDMKTADEHESKHNNHYFSSAFLISYNLTNEGVLIFGDFESDLISHLSKNLQIWEHIAPLIMNPDKPLKAIILECSSNSILNVNELYGHLMPVHLINELKVLNNECLKINNLNPQPLKNFNIIVNHVKEPVNALNDPRQKILNDLNSLSEEENLGLKFSIALSGVSIII